MNLNLMQKRILVVLVGVIVLLAVFFLVFQKNMETVSVIQGENKKLENEINRLSTLQTKVNEMRAEASDQQSLTNEFTYSFPPKMPQQKAIFNVYRVMVESGIDISSISPGGEQNFWKSGHFINFDGREMAIDNSQYGDATVTGSAVEADPETQVSLREMVGKSVTYSLTVSGTLKQILNAIDYVRDSEEPMSLTSLSLSFDSKTGKLTGTMQVSFHALNGNGVTYEEPDVDDIKIGTKNLFGLLKEK